MVHVPEDPDNYPESYHFEAASGTLHVGNGSFAPVSDEVFNFSVSGFPVVRSWLDYRMKGIPGRSSSPLDEIRPQKWSSQFTTELLELLWLIEQTIEIQPQLDTLLLEIIGGEVFLKNELPEVADYEREAPGVEGSKIQEQLYI